MNLAPDNIYPDLGERVTVNANDLHELLDLIEEVIEDRDDAQPAIDRCRLLLDAQAPNLVGHVQRRVQEHWASVMAGIESGRTTWRTWNPNDDGGQVA